MKVRARVKAPEQLPEWARCCEACIGEIAAHDGEIFEVEASRIRHTHGAAKCKFCGNRTLDPGPYVDGLCYVALLDIDEGCCA